MTGQPVRSVAEASNGLPDIGLCLDRLGYSGPAEPGIGLLHALQNAFLLHVPFENIDIIRGRKISLSPTDVYGKIVERRRGGVCYECNILFHDLLASLGFRVSFLSARMVMGSSSGPDCDHMVLMVSLDRDYLVDVGKGQSFREPLLLDGSSNVVSEGMEYRVGRVRDEYALYSRRGGRAWGQVFLFGAAPRMKEEFDEMNEYHQTSPDSPFKRREVITIATPGGRVTMIDRHITIRNGAVKRQRLMKSEEEYRRALRQYFGIELTSEQAARQEIGQKPLAGSCPSRNRPGEGEHVLLDQGL